MGVLGGSYRNTIGLLPVILSYYGHGSNTIGLDKIYFNKQGSNNCI